MKTRKTDLLKTKSFLLPVSMLLSAHISLSWALFKYKLTNDIANQSTCHLILGNTPEEKDSEELYFPDKRNLEDL